jgi:hypothetical protein
MKLRSKGQVQVSRMVLFLSVRRVNDRRMRSLQCQTTVRTARPSSRVTASTKVSVLTSFTPTRILLSSLRVIAVTHY